MMKFSLFLVFLCFNFSLLFSQEKYEREHRINKTDFPAKASDLIQEKIVDSKKIKFYKEIDSLKITFKAKFKEDRLWYSIDFNKDGDLDNIKVQIKSVDIPNDSFETITSYLEDSFKSYKIKNIQQKYAANNEVDVTFKNAFQNLMLPSLQYELLIAGKMNTHKEQFQILFDAEGVFKSSRKSLPPNYDHVLY
mgnify:FL=1